MGEWITDTVINLQARGLLRVEDGNHGESRPRPNEFSDVGVAFIRAADIDYGNVLFAKASKINEIARKRITKGIGKSGDIIISHKGTVGKIARAPIDSPEFVCSPQTTFWRSTNREVLSQDFLYVYMRSPKFMQEFLVRSGETDMAGYVSLTSQRCLFLTIPPIEIQYPISGLIGALDDKIELNRHMNKTLEAAAQAIFKDWFVDFGPTRAKMEGRAPYLAPDMWSLFPGRLDNEGKPEGWVFRTLGDVAKQVGEAVQPEALDPGTPYIGLEHMPRKSIALSEWEGADKVTSGKLIFRKGDFLFGKLRPYFHKVGIAPIDGICSTDIVVLNAREQKVAAFVLACISQDEFVAFTDRTSDGTKMPRTSWARMERYRLCLPSGSGLEAFNVCVEPLLERIVSNIHESRTLADTRDFLLPKLMSGEVRVRDADNLVSKAT
jgi:type I restriction enzyme, S subunit